ncbi:hypothetical protein R1sor_019343 [Riccia sorocarpa]|uniref:Gamma carbonic anhydrase-like 1, mitochondrial n=1 Tax=Riccia sorocarpa TaxID=122646 RepID=A0ABD3IGF0_9MARC
MAGLVRHARGTGMLRNLARIVSSSSSAPALTLIGGSRVLPQACDFFSNSAKFTHTKPQCRDMATVAWDYRGQRQVVPLGLKVPDIAVDAFVAPNVVLVGSVYVQDRASVFYGCVLRGDMNKIVVGFSSNLGDKCVLHAAPSSPTGLSAETQIGKYVTVGNFSVLRSCIIEDEVVIGERCVIMEGSLVETHAILEAGSVLPPGRRIPSGEVWAGNPAKFVREVTYDEIAVIPRLAEGIREIAENHMGTQEMTSLLWEKQQNEGFTTRDSGPEWTVLSMIYEQW